MTGKQKHVNHNFGHKIPIIFLAASTAAFIIRNCSSFIVLINILYHILVGAALYTEHLFKSSNVKGETFLDQQFWMYFYESLVAILLHSITNSSYTVMSLTSDLLGMY
jgi:hypothetical protein